MISCDSHNMTRSTAAYLLFLLLPLTACGPELVGSAGQTAEVRTTVTSEDQLTPARLPDNGGAYLLALSDNVSTATTINAVIHVEARATLLSDRGETPLTGDGAAGSFRIEGPDSITIGRTDVRTGEYGLARIEFTEVKAEVTDGLDVGGMPILGEVQVQIAPGQAVVKEVPVQLTVERFGKHTVVIDLNAAAWLAQVDLVTRGVSAVTFGDAIEVRVR